MESDANEGLAERSGSETSEVDDLPNEREALAAGLAIVGHYEPSGESDFDKGMRLLQQALGVKKRKSPNHQRSEGCATNNKETNAKR